jgi:hypothetical protein
MALTAYTMLGLSDQLQAYGHQYLGTPRAQEIMDQAAQRAILEELWPFRVRSAPVTNGQIAADQGNIGPIKQVSTVVGGVTKILAPLNEDQINDRLSGSGIAFGAAGTPKNYVVRWTDGERTLAFDPAVTGVTIVTHWSELAWVNETIPENVGDNAIPVWPRTHREVLLAAGRVLAYEDVDDYEAAAQQEMKYQRKLDEARDQLLNEQWDEPDYMSVRGEMV